MGPNSWYFYGMQSKWAAHSIVYKIKETWISVPVLPLILSPWLRFLTASAFSFLSPKLGQWERISYNIIVRIKWDSVWKELSMRPQHLAAIELLVALFVFLLFYLNRVPWVWKAFELIQRKKKKAHKIYVMEW